MNALLQWLAHPVSVSAWQVCLGVGCAFIVGVQLVAACWICYLCRAIAKDRDHE